MRCEIREHYRENSAARRARYSDAMRTLHLLYDNRSFGYYIGLYACFAVIVAQVEVAFAYYALRLPASWAADTNLNSTLGAVTGFLISAQVGVLGVISIAIGLVALIAQRERQSTDVQVYYHESMAFGVVASSISLAAILCAQLLWPVQNTLYSMGIGTNQPFFKLILTFVHLGWLLLNLSGLAHFIAITLAFVKQSDRERLREHYTANVVLPVQMRKKLREQLYLIAGRELSGKSSDDDNGDDKAPTVWFGHDFGQTDVVEVGFTSKRKIELNDVRMVWVQWVVNRWLKRCKTIPSKKTAGLVSDTILMFPPILDQTVANDVALCKRRGGLPLTRTERFIILRAFMFRRSRDET